MFTDFSIWNETWIFSTLSLDYFAQNLVVTNEEFIVVGPAQTQTFPLHASCANGSAQAPAGDEMNVTPFIFNNLGNTFQDQASVWQSFDGEGRRTTRL